MSGNDAHSSGHTYQYELYQMASAGSSSSYGILGRERLGGAWATVAVIAAFSDNREAVMRLAEKCTDLQLSPGQLLDVVSDFIAQESMDAPSRRKRGTQ